MGDVEIGTCDICMLNNTELSRKYYYYDIECECCVGKHSAYCKYCKNCSPEEPEETKIYIKTAKLNRWEEGN